VMYRIVPATPRCSLPSSRAASPSFAAAMESV
jgi:hypothetical protein